MAGQKREPIPLSQRNLDRFLFIPFFLLNITFITYFVDIEQITTLPPIKGKPYPYWPPKPVVDLVRWYGHTFDLLLIARPPFWQAAIWWDVLFFGPFYAFGIYALIKGKDWIRIPAIIYSSVIVTLVSVILTEELFGQYAADDFLLVFALNGPWMFIPLILLWRMTASGEHPLTKEPSLKKLQ